MRGLLGVAVLLSATIAHAESARPRLDRVPTKVDLSNAPLVVNSHTIFINRCVGGCRIYPGESDSRTNKSEIGSGQLSAFSFGDASWNAVKACMVNTFSRFNVTITDVDPGPNVDHFEVMIAGSPQQIGLGSGIGGIANYPCNPQSPGSCERYIPNTIAFAFAQVYSGASHRDLEICATAAQEIAHTFTLDHVDDVSDPMTYRPFSGMRQFKDNAPCGSDCFGGQTGFGQTCTGTGQQRHICLSTGGPTQNDVQILLALFGPAGAVAPTLRLTNPTNNSTQPPTFSIDVDCTSSDQIQEVNLWIDGVPKGSMTTPPFKFMAQNLTDGPHTVKVLCASKLQATSTATAAVLVGQSCTDDTQCQDGYICFNSACVAGPGATGGLGSDCVDNADCVSGVCASDGATMACTIGCDVSQNNCPAGFGCLDAGGGNGVCWAGIDDGGGCCDAGGGNPGAILFGLGVFAALVTRRIRR